MFKRKFARLDFLPSSRTEKIKGRARYVGSALNPRRRNEYPFFDGNSAIEDNEKGEFSVFRD